MNVPPRALVIGASETAQLLHLPVLAKLRDMHRLELVEICDLQLSKAVAARHRFGFLRDSGDAASAIARAHTDVVYVFGGCRMHHALGLAALNAGKHLFVEKPIAPSYAEAIELANAAEARHLIAVGGHNRRFLAAFERIRASAASSGWTFAEAAFHKPEFGRPPLFGAATWLSANGIHALDALLFMMGGLPEWVSAQATGTSAIPSIFSATMRWPTGAQAVLLCNNEAGTRREEYSFHVPGESFRVSDGGLIIERQGAQSFIDLPQGGDGFAAEHEAFLHSVATAASPRHAISKLAPSLFLAELIEAAHHGAVRLPTKISPARRPVRTHSVLVSNPARLRGALNAIPPDWRLVSIDEVQRSSEPYPDITAALLGQGAAPLDDHILDKLPNLQIVAVAGLSLRRYGPDRLLDRGITLVNASHAYADSVAEFVLGLAILGRRQAFTSSTAMRLGGWGAYVPARGVRAIAGRAAHHLRRVARSLGLEPALRRAWFRSSGLVRLSSALSSRQHNPPALLSGAVVGLIGWGANARESTKRLIAADARVIVYSAHGSAEDIRACKAEPTALASVLAADIVSLHRGLTPATRHCIGAAELALLRPGAVLINAARGELIEPSALIDRLKRGDIVACLDTFEEEPLPPRHRLRRMPNVFLTPHIAGGSPDMHAAAAREVTNKLVQHLQGAPAEKVTAARLATMT
ncbi:MAG: NAD(P)-dependent oxidoreductase [Pseudomonadota bacterium]